MALLTACGAPYQATDWQHIGDEIKAAMISARADFVNVFLFHDYGTTLEHSFLWITR